MDYCPFLGKKKSSQPIYHSNGEMLIMLLFTIELSITKFSFKMHDY